MAVSMRTHNQGSLNSKYWLRCDRLASNVPGQGAVNQAVYPSEINKQVPALAGSWRPLSSYTDGMWLV